MTVELNHMEAKRNGLDDKSGEPKKYLIRLRPIPYKSYEHLEAKIEIERGKYPK